MGRKLKIHPPERLKDGHELDGFDCGVHSMNHWLKRVARRANHDTAAVFIVREGSKRVIAYYATAMGGVPLVSAGKIGTDAPDPIPVFVLGRLAVDKNFQRRGLGQDLVVDVFRRAMRASHHAGARAVVVHTLTDDLKDFYAALGFKPLEPDGKTMYVTLDELRQAL